METFVVRVWRPAPGHDLDDAGRELHGTVLHPATGTETPFSTDHELLHALRTLPDPSA